MVDWLSHEMFRFFQITWCVKCWDNGVWRQDWDGVLVSILFCRLLGQHLFIQLSKLLKNIKIQLLDNDELTVIFFIIYEYNMEPNTMWNAITQVLLILGQCFKFNARTKRTIRRCNSGWGQWPSELHDHSQEWMHCFCLLMKRYVGGGGGLETFAPTPPSANSQPAMTKHIIVIYIFLTGLFPLTDL